MRPLNAVAQLVATGVDARPLAVLRMVVGGNAILCGVEAWSILSGVVRPGGMRLPFVALLGPLPESWLGPFMMAWFVAAAVLALGWYTRCVGMILACQMAYVLLVDEQTYSNHLYLLTLEVVYLVLGNAGASWSLDAWRRGGIELAPAWPIALWKLQISIVYLFAAVAKINPTFLSGEVLATYWPTSGVLEFLAPLRTPEWLQPLAWGAVATEAFLALALWLRPLRRLAVVVGVGLHAGMIALVAQKDPTGIIVFALATLPPYLLFFVGDETRAESGNR